MINYSLLKTDKKQKYPTYDSFLPITLKIAFNKPNWRGNKLKIAVVRYIKSLTDAPTLTNNNLLIQRAGFAISWLYSQYKLLDRPFRGTYRINDRGKELLYKYNDYQSQFQAIKNIPRIPKKSIEKHDDTKKRIENSHEDNIEFQVNSRNKSLRSKLLSKIMSNSPSFFEYLVTTLLEKMGYKGRNGQGITTQQTRDHGIDGIINQDPLGTRTVLIQAKRYKPGDNIPSYQIRDFYGAISSRNAGRGVFITTSNFSKDAVRQAKRLSIVIINGKELTDLMLKYHVGVQVKETYQILNIDNDFFEE